MGTPDNMSSYADVRDTLDRALAAERGIRVTLTSPGEAIHLRQRLYKFRILDRRESVRVWAEGDPRRGVSVYDDLTVTTHENTCVIRKFSARTLDIEELEV